MVVLPIIIDTFHNLRFSTQLKLIAFNEMMIMHQAAATMTGMAIIALSIKMKKKEVKFQSVRKCYTIRNDFVACCPAQPNSGYVFGSDINIYDTNGNGDINCGELPSVAKQIVISPGSNPYRLDGDGDGFGCEG